MMHPNRSGFTLVELSIVLVILGLLTGGVLVGKSVLRNTEVDSIIKDKNTYTSALLTFRDRYKALPGDMDNATATWGAANADADSCAALTAQSSGTLTCNGNGNGRIATLGQAGEYYEAARAWQQLAASELISGKYTGVAGSGGGLHMVPGTNCPSSKISSAGFSIGYIGASTTLAWLFDGVYDHAIFFGAESAGNYNIEAALTPEEAWNFDKKFDDGYPARGAIVSALTLSSCHDGSGASDLDADYTATIDRIACGLIFRNVLN